MSSKVAVLALAVSAAYAQFTPLAQKRFEYTNLPYKADTDTGERGTQFGYNICNSTTEGPNSLCQTAMINSLDDFCLWGPPEPNSLIGNTEGEAVAWCTKPGRGTRVMPPGTLTGVQFMRTPSYVQVIGTIDQSKINLAPKDDGGEMDPHGADRRGNPLGGLVFSNAFPSNGGNNNTYQQVIEWHNFMGANQFCLKACDPTGPNDDKFCEHIFDRIGCAYNAPGTYKEGTFETCQGDDQDFPGIYTKDGQIITYKQPAESLGAITTMPYDPKIPASSNCVPFQSTQLYGAGPAASTPSASSSGSAASSPSRTGSTVPSATASASSSSNGASNTLASFSVLTVGTVVVSALFGALAVL
ncbi:hypothetical protein FRC10_008091 [Ceratobasidium sp. 414]|nr:hypothetical protein FRC10_008091 [Ceratobasidium sp. 414]